MPPQWTQPLDVSNLHPSPSPLRSPQFDYEAQFRYPVHDVPTTPSMTFRVQSAESRHRKNLNRPLHSRPSHVIPHPRPVLPRLPRLNRPPKPRRVAPMLRLNRLHPPLPSDLTGFSQPVRSEFLRVSAAAARKYAPAPDPVDEHDNSLYEFPSFATEEDTTHRLHARQHHSQTPLSIEEPRRRNIQYLIERYNNNNNKHPSETQSPQDRPSPISSDSVASPSPDIDTEARHFDIRSVRDIFERHTQKLEQQIDMSLSSITDSASPSNVSNTHLAPQSPANSGTNAKTEFNAGTSSPIRDDRPRRIAFADLSNTLELSPCPSSTSDSHPNDRDVPSAASLCPRPPPTALTAEMENLPPLPPVGRKKSFAVFKPIKDGMLDRMRARSFANGERPSAQPFEQTSDRRFTDAERRKKKKDSKHARSYGASVRRRFESFRNMISANDY